ncbi:MAG: RDD family protein [Myxococcales bacterium]|nr:RDD family protein [Myxococcales bacterium]
MPIVDDDSPFAAPEHLGVIDDGTPIVDLELAAPADHGARFFASLVDGVLAGLLGYIGAIVVGVVMAFGMVLLGGNPDALADNPLFVLSFAVGFVGLQALYFAVFESSRYAASPGKLMLGLKVVTDGGLRMTFGQAMSRALTKQFLLNLCWILAVLVLSDPLHKGPWGSVTNTRVVNRPRYP